MEKEFEGAVRDFGWEFEKAAAGLPDGERQTQIEGKWRQVVIQAQKTFGPAVDEIRGNVINRPLTVLAIAGGMFFALGYLIGKKQPAPATDDGTDSEEKAPGSAGA